MPLSEIHAWVVLQASTTHLTVREIPCLTALAMYPPVAPEHSHKVVTDILKIPNRDANPPSKPVRFPEDEWATLMAIWAKLPPIRFPLSLPLDDWTKYVEAFERSPHQPTWGIHPQICDERFNQSLLFNSLRREHEQQLENAIMQGRVSTLSPLTKLPHNYTVGDAGKDSLVSIRQFRDFASTLGIGVKPMREFTKSPYPEQVDDVLRELPDHERILIHDNIGGGTGLTMVASAVYRAEIQATIERQAAGFFTVDEAAQVLADSQPGVDARSMIRQMRTAFKAQTLVIRRAGDYLPVSCEREIRNFYDVVKVSDINEWLDGAGVGYQFPQHAPLGGKPRDEVSEHGGYADANQQNGKLTKREQQICAIEAVVRELGLAAMQIPTGGKQRVRAICKSKYAHLFGAGNDPFKEAWQAAVTQNRVRMLKHTQYAKK